MEPHELIEVKDMWDKRAADSIARIDRELHVLSFIRTQQARVIGELASQGVIFLLPQDQAVEQPELIPPDAS